MSSNRLIQYLEKEGYSPYPGGSNIPTGVDAMNRRELETFLVAASPLASTTLTLVEGDVVVFALTDGGDSEDVISVKKTVADGAAIGVAVEGGTSETDGSIVTIQQSKVRVCLSGICEAKVKGANNAGNAAIAAGDYLCQSDTAGVFYKYTAGTDAMPHAIAVDDVASGAAAAAVTVCLLKQF